MKKSELEKIILEQYATISERKKFEDLPVAFKNAIEKRYGKLHPKDFFSDDLSRYMKFDGENKETGEVTHKVIPIPSFNKMYDDFQDIVDDIKDPNHMIYTKSKTHYRNNYACSLLSYVNMCIFYI